MNPVPSLVPWCHSMKSQLRGVYRQCFITENTVGGGSPRCLSPSLQGRALTMVQEKLMDWKDFLLLKSLIHFIYVDRTAGQMIAPSLNITDRATSELGKGPLGNFIKGKVWGLVNTSRLYLQKGYSTVTLRDGDDFFCYLLWFKNEMVNYLYYVGYTKQGLEVKLEVKYLPILLDDAVPIGMLAWDYY
ncbi:unnamed protein product, partial [Coregonus sp. 'balchen']